MRPFWASLLPMPSGARKSFGDCSSSAAGRSPRRPCRATSENSVSCAPRRTTGLVTSARNHSAAMMTNPRWRPFYLNSSTRWMASVSCSSCIHCRAGLSPSPKQSMPRVGRRLSERSGAKIPYSLYAALRRPDWSSPIGCERSPDQGDPRGRNGGPQGPVVGPTIILTPARHCA